MEYIITIAVCIAVVAISRMHITVNINHTYPEQPVQSAPSSGATQEDLDRAYTESNPNNFDDVIKSINAEFGGVDNGEDTTT